MNVTIHSVVNLFVWLNCFILITCPAGQTLITLQDAWRQSEHESVFCVCVSSIAKVTFCYIECKEKTRMHYYVIVLLMETFNCGRKEFRPVPDRKTVFSSRLTRRRLTQLWADFVVNCLFACSFYYFYCLSLWCCVVVSLHYGGCSRWEKLAPWLLEWRNKKRREKGKRVQQG